MEMRCNLPGDSRSEAQGNRLFGGPHRALEI